MEKDAVIKIRETFRKATFSLYNKKTGEKTTFAPIIHIVLDNSVNIFSMEAEPGNPLNNQSTVIWDDDNELLWWFRANTASSSINSPSSSMGFGDQPDFAMELIASNFEQIQNMRIIINQEAFENIANILIDEGVMTEVQKENIYRNIFEEADMRVVLQRKKEVNYNTGQLKKYDPEYNEDSGYAFATHIQTGGGV